MLITHSGRRAYNPWARTDFRYGEGRGHFDLYTVGDDRWALYKTIAWEIYALARPGSKPPTVSVHE